MWATQLQPGLFYLITPQKYSALGCVYSVSHIFSVLIQFLGVKSIFGFKSIIPFQISFFGFDSISRFEINFWFQVNYSVTNKFFSFISISRFEINFCFQVSYSVSNIFFVYRSIIRSQINFLVSSWFLGLKSIFSVSRQFLGLTGPPF